MIAVTPLLTTNLAPRRNRRSAFTLLEVLVVVAILVVLASVASIAVFKQLDDSKNDKARLDMQSLETAYKAIVLRSGGEVNQSNFNLEMLIPELEQGQLALIDPWQKPYSFRFGQSATGNERIQFFTFSKSGEEIAWPRQ